jgi:hypothetical protein
LQRRDYINRKNKTEKGERKKSGKSYCYDIGGTDTPQIETSGQKGFACENKKVPSKLIFVEMSTDFGVAQYIYGRYYYTRALFACIDFYGQ